MGTDLEAGGHSPATEGKLDCARSRRQWLQRLNHTCRQTCDQNRATLFQPKLEIPGKIIKISKTPKKNV
jgi:hypothetical protein